MRGMYGPKKISISATTSVDLLNIYKTIKYLIYIS